MCTSDAPASKASCVDSTCSAGVTGTAGLSFFFGTAPVIATVMMTGWAMITSVLSPGRADCVGGAPQRGKDLVASPQCHARCRAVHGDGRTDSPAGAPDRNSEAHRTGEVLARVRAYAAGMDPLQLALE